MVRDRLGIPVTDGFITDGVIDTNINLAIAAFSAEHFWPWDETKAIVTLTSGTPELALPDDWAAMRAVTHMHEVLVHMPLYDMDRFVPGQSGHPRYYSVLDEDIVVAPTPSEPWEINLYYFREPLLLDTDESTTRIPRRHTNGIVAKACSLCATRESERGEATDHMLEYASAVSRARKELNRKSTRGLGRRIRPGAWV